MAKQVSGPMLVSVLAMAGLLQGCASGAIMIDAAPEVPVSAFTAAHDRRVCHDAWPSIAIEAAERLPADHPGRWPAQFAARRMMHEALDRVTARSRCMDAIDHGVTLVLRPHELYFRDSQVSTFVFQPGVDFDLEVTVMAEHEGPVGHWLIRLRVWWPYEPFRGIGGRNIDTRHKAKESEYAYLTHEAMIYAIELALECLRARDGREAIRAFMIDPERPQCLPPGRARQPQVVNQSYFQARFQR
ncbi:MAG: hypothetical protein JJU27_18830 [Gammaproteobacteria bacterium]|nr:hypothetical protein [Gammaproteobacteria bacterium]